MGIALNGIWHRNMSQNTEMCLYLLLRWNELKWTTVILSLFNNQLNVCCVIFLNGQFNQKWLSSSCRSKTCIFFSAWTQKIIFWIAEYNVFTMTVNGIQNNSLYAPQNTDLFFHMIMLQVNLYLVNQEISICKSSNEISVAQMHTSELGWENGPKLRALSFYWVFPWGTLRNSPSVGKADWYSSGVREQM